MDGMIALNLFLVAVFIFLTAFFVGAEFAILKVRMSRLDQLIEENNKKAKVAKEVVLNLDFYLSACQLGITITALVLGALGEPTVEKILRPLFDYFSIPTALAKMLSYVIALAVVTFFHVVFGELAPKTLAIQYSEKMTLLLAPPLYWFGKIMNPVIRFLNGASRNLLRIFGVQPSKHETAHTEEELKLIVNQSFESGEINQAELTYLENIFAFDERVLKDIMIPRHEMITLEKSMSMPMLLGLLEQHDFTRYPVKDAEAGDIIGYINTKEMLTSSIIDKNISLQDFIHDIPKFREISHIKDVLLSMQKTRMHMALVKNEDNEAIGMVTMEDILEEIVGEIKDESSGVS
ncbi:magnesium and cobalt exporter, CNNM family [Cytobacillus horneckiae]|uniref:hemolysin family protein n=1 Tax=Cytobacillus horneckiae TaxID=549687 RepID=UPI0019CF57A8|nr:hemolysin family protein [Cytobacillus horneckiae]MBN6887415.1 HlyC/CorC family transporter [Cytobacillus horneckiae]